MTTPHPRRNSLSVMSFLLERWLLAAALIGLSSSVAVSAADVFATALSGQPYGVATIEVPLDVPVAAASLPPIQAISDGGVILYPFSEDVRVKAPRASDLPVPPAGQGRLLGRLGSLIREIASPNEDVQQTVARRIMFLFTGDQPFRIRLFDGQVDYGTFQITPVADPAARQVSIGKWWAGYTAAAKAQIDSADYPPLVEDYLVAMLSRRLGLPLPAWYADTQDEDDQLTSTLKLIAGAEGAGEAIFRRQAAGLVDGNPLATMSVPAGPRWSPLFQRAGLADVAVEPMATRVPPECFYIRYGSFANYDWFSSLSAQYGGDISRMVTLRGFETKTTAKIEDQLHLKTTELSRMLAPSVIEDQAIIGRDLFMGDGATIGVLFKAKNQFLLSTSLSNDRSGLARKDDEVSLVDLKIADRGVTLLSSADNRVRSFMVADDGFILVTNSRAMVERFLQVSDSKQSLAASPSFRLARQLMPLERNDTVFAYFSPEMLRGLIAPQNLIELRRRLVAKAEIAQLHLARLAAQQESGASENFGVDDLIGTGFLPASFGARGDRSGAVSVGDEVIDTLRGGRGNFIPIADVQIDGVTADEAQWYGSIARVYEQEFPTIDPIMLGLQREQIPAVPGAERITVHAEIAPWEPEKYGQWAQQLGPPTDIVMQFAPDDIVAVQAHVASPQLGPPTHLFVAIKDMMPPDPDNFDGILNIYRSLRGMPGYVGAWPQPGALDRLPLGIGVGQPIGPGMNRLLGGVYRYSDGQFSLLSFQPEVINAALPHLIAGQAPDRAQLRGQVGNLQGSQLEGWVNNQLYQRASQSSLAGARFLSLIGRQLSIPPDRTAEVAEQVLGVKLQCPLGGDYQWASQPGRWTSTAWGGQLPAPEAPLDYVAPPMQWFRGSQATVTQYQDRLVADAIIDVQRQ